MKKTFLIFAVALLSVSAFGQTKMRNGYQAGDSRVSGSKVATVDSTTLDTGRQTNYAKGDTLDPVFNVGSLETSVAEADSATGIYGLKKYATSNDLMDYKNPVWEMNLMGSKVKAANIGFNLVAGNTTVSLSDGTARLACVWVDRPMLIDTVKWVQAVTGDYTADKYNGIAIYSESGGVLTRRDSVLSDDDIWKATTHTLQTSVFTAGYQVTTPQFVYIIFSYNQSAQTTAPTVAGNTVFDIAMSSLDYTNNKVVAGTVGIGTYWPSTIELSTVTSNQNIITVLLY